MVSPLAEEEPPLPQAMVPIAIAAINIADAVFFKLFFHLFIIFLSSFLYSETFGAKIPFSAFARQCLSLADKQKWRSGFIQSAIAFCFFVFPVVEIHYIETAGEVNRIKFALTPKKIR